MRIPWVFVRDNTECASGTQYYTCASNGFKGCCVVDACDYDEGCPDEVPGGHSSTSSPATAMATLTIVVGVGPSTTSTSKAQPTSTTSPITSSTTSSSTTLAVPPTSSAPFTVAASHSASAAHKSTAASSASLSASAAATSTLEATGTPSSTAVAGSGKGQATSSHKLSNGAIGGIVTASVLVFLVLIAVVLWKMRRRNKDLERQASMFTSGSAGAGVGAGPDGYPGLPPTASPGLAQSQAQPTLNEKVIGSVSQSGGPLLYDADKFNSVYSSNHDSIYGSNQLGISELPSNRATNGASPGQVTEMQGTPLSATVPLFSEAPTGDSEGDIARWGLHGARLAAQRRLRMHGSVRSGDNLDYGGSYMGPGLEQGVSPPPPTQPNNQIAELDSHKQSMVVAELDTPLPTPLSTHLSTPGISAYSPSLSGTGTLTTPELYSTPRMASVSSMLQPSGPIPLQSHPPAQDGAIADTPRATLEVSQTERRHGVNVTSWGSYSP
ncbi:MAG: hypothetical protein STHCBS139747_006164 [Sporothrix thermara]